MQGDPRVIEYLQLSMREETAAIIQYTIAAEMCRNWGYHQLAHYLMVEARQEMHHLRHLVERILFLEETPDMTGLELLPVGASVPEILRNIWNAEVQAVRTYNEAVRVASSESMDEGSANLFRENLQDEEHHIEWLESQLSLIDQMGLVSYLSQQLFEQRGEEP